MIPEGVDVFGRRAIVTAAPFSWWCGERWWDNGHVLEIGDEVAVVRRSSDNVIVMGQTAATPTIVAADCLTLVPPQPVPLDPIGPEVAAHVLWHYRQLGYPPGSFTSDLIRTIAGADPGNRRLLARAFPAYVRAVSLAADDPGGIDRLRQVLITRVPI